MIEACTPETIWKRFEVHSKEVFLKRAEGFFSCGGEGELVVVAELVERPGTLVGEARLCLIPGGEVAEFCVLVADPWQGKGLGSLLTELALRMGKERGVKRVLVEVVSENVTIINFLRKRGFRFRRDPDGLIFLGEKQL
jgi:acetyltransferase